MVSLLVRLDDLSALFLLQVAECVAVPLTLIYNIPLEVGTAWKRSNVTLMYKGGNADDPGNYHVPHIYGTKYC